jgi:hypothetical protein
VGAPAAEVESCRVTLLLEGEAVILDEMGGGAEPPETVIAFALCDLPSPSTLA